MLCPDKQLYATLRTLGPSGGAEHKRTSPRFEASIQCSHCSGRHAVIDRLRQQLPRYRVSPFHLARNGKAATQWVLL